MLIRDEDDRDVLEHIRYHRYIGIDKFYIRENGPQSRNDAVLGPLIERGIVDYGLAPGPKHPTQTDWYIDCAKMAAPDYRWIAFVDLDEYIVVLDKQKAVTARNALKRLLNSPAARDASSITMQWIMFGTSGHYDRPEGGQLAGYNKCTGVLSFQMKCLAQTKWLHPNSPFEPLHVHQCMFRMKAQSVYGDLTPIAMYTARVLETGHVGRTHRGHLQEENTPLSDAYKVVVFHYVTKNAKFFLDVKVNRQSGKYATEFSSGDRERSKQIQLQHLRDYEHAKGFDGDHPICQEGQALAEALPQAAALRRR